MKVKELFEGQLPALVMYDLDGTLVDSVPDLARAIDIMLEALGLPLAGAEKVTRWVGNGTAAMVLRALADDDNGDEPGRVDDALFKKGYALFEEAYDNECGRQTHIYDGVMACLESFKEAGIAQVIVTNKPARFTDALIARLGIDHFFDLVLSGDSLEQKKPDPLPLNHAMSKFSSSKAQTLMVGDSRNDVRAARAAGVKAACVPYGYNHGLPIATAEPDLIVANLAELV